MIIGETVPHQSFCEEPSLYSFIQFPSSSSESGGEVYPMVQVEDVLVMPAAVRASEHVGRSAGIDAGVIKRGPVIGAQRIVAVYRETDTAGDLLQAVM